MAGTMDILIREMTIADYDQVYGLWTEIKGFGIRSIDDSREGVERFLGRNPTTSVVAVQNGHIVGNILCGHAGRLLLSRVRGAGIQETRHWIPHGALCHGGPSERRSQQNQPDCV